MGHRILNGAQNAHIINAMQFIQCLFFQRETPSLDVILVNFNLSLSRRNFGIIN